MSIYRCEKFINEYWAANCCAPTMRNIKDALGLSSLSVVSALVDRLVLERGYNRTPGKAASIVPPWVREAIQSATPKNGESPRGISV